MAEYKNNEGWEPSHKTLDYWRFIPMEKSKYEGFEMPPLFKGVNPLINWMIIGFIAIFLLEGYATFLVAMPEGVPIEIITLLVLVDVFLAVLPHIKDGKRTDLKNFIFIGDYAEKFLLLDEDDKNTYQNQTINNQNKLKNLNITKLLLYIPIVLSAGAKLYLFFGQYPFWGTYQAYIVLISYILGCILHIMCTGYVIMFWRFRARLKKDKNRFGQSNGKFNKIKSRPDRLISPRTDVAFNIVEENLSNQKLVMHDDKYYLHCHGLLFDEEISDLISQQDTLKQQMPVALAGKIAQTKLLTGIADK
jgi:hypothetical protein